jgi:hypothetical protein
MINQRGPSISLFPSSPSIQYVFDGLMHLITDCQYPMDWTKRERYVFDGLMHLITDCQYPMDWTKRERHVLAYSHEPHGIRPCLLAQGSSGAVTHPVVPALASRLGCRHMSCDVSSCLPARDSSGTTMCSVVSAPTSRLGAARVPPRVPWHSLPPPCWRHLGCRHVSRGANSRLLA